MENSKRHLIMFLVWIQAVVALDRGLPLDSGCKIVSVRWLSYIPPLSLNAKFDGLYPVSIKKINYFSEETNEQMTSERFKPVIDKILVIPSGFHEYDS